MGGTREPTADELNGVKQDTVEWDLYAYRSTYAVVEERRAYNANGQVEYIGEAVPGSEDGEEVWRIHKRTYVNNRLTKISWADYNAKFDKEWDERTTYDYR